MIPREKWSWLKRLAWNVIGSGKPSDYDLDKLRKYYLFNSAIILGLIFLPSLGFLALVQGNSLLFGVDYFVALCLLGILFYLRKSLNIEVVGIVGTIFLGIFYLFLIIYGGIKQSAHIWGFTYPLISLFLLGKRAGTYLSFLFLVCCSIIFAASFRYDFISRYDATLVVRFAAAYLLVYLLGMIMEFTRERIHDSLLDSKADLETVLKKLRKSSNNLGITNTKLQEEIVERERIERALRDSERFLVDIIESIQDGIVVLDTNLTIRHANSVVLRWSGQEDSLIGKKCYESLFHREQPCESCAAIRCLQSGKTERVMMNLTYDPLVEFIEAYSFPIRDEVSGKITGVVESIRDITKQKQLESQLAQAQKMEAVGTLAGGVAHDLNNILSGIVSYPDLLLTQLPKESPMRKNILTIQKSGQKAAAIVQDLLALARRGVPVHKVINLGDIISTFLSSPEFNKIQEFHPQMVTELALQPDLLNIIGSPLHLSKTLTNLVSNAAEAMAEGGILKIEAYNQSLGQAKEGYEEIPPGEYVVMAVTDIGSGISHKDLSKIFEPFFTKKQMGRSGTGLGMSVVWGTVKDHSGFIDITSNVGQGSSFSLYFPATRFEVSQQKDTVPLKDVRGTGRILVVDDMSEQREIASEILSSLGYEVDSVSSGENAIEYLRKMSVDLVILDMVMEPGMDGLSTYAEIQKLSPNQKTIIVSGYSETVRVKEAQRLGAGTYIKKPYTIIEIGLAVRAELGSSDVG